LQRDLASAVTLLAVAVAYYAFARDLDATALADEVGPAGLPLVYAGLLALLAILLAADTFTARFRARSTATATAGDEPRPGRRLRRAAGVLAIGVGYLVVAPVIGYPFAVALAIAVTALHEGERPSLRLALVACGGAAALYVLFEVLLGVAMPAPWNA
jgi:hypothetical protein